MGVPPMSITGVSPVHESKAKMALRPMGKMPMPRTGEL